MEKEIICTVCPNSCLIKVQGQGECISSISGFRCPRGEKYGRQEFIRPMRILTSSVKIEGREDSLLPVRSEGPLPLELTGQCMEEIRRARVSPPVRRRQVIIENICGSGCNIIASGELS